MANNSLGDELHGVNASGSLRRRSALALAVASALSVGHAYGQEATADDTDDSAAPIEEIVTTGIRSSLQSAQALKRNADTVIESITAEDLGDFPDKSIAEALQRVAGITVNRFAASDDTAHFSAEPSGVIVRGLNMVRTEFNGRDSFSANSSRGLSWGDVSPELMAGIDTYKNQMAELIEGGIAGTVNMRTRLPFDQEDRTLALSLAANYGDLSEEVTPEGSGLWSDRWELASGAEVGALANVAYSEVQTRTEGIQLYRMNRFRDVYGDNTLYYIPAIVSMRDNIYDRTREGASLAFQFASPEDTFLLSAQYNRSEYDNAWEEYLVQTSPADLSFSQSVFYEIEGQSVNSYDNNATIPIPAPGTPAFTFDNQGLFESGVMTTGTGWWGADNNEAAGFARNAAGQNMVNACYGWNGCEPVLRGIDTAAVTRSNNNENMTQDFGLNLKWEISDRLRSNFDLQYVDSEVQNYDIEVAFWTYAVADVDLSGEHPTLELMNPINVNQSDGGFSNPNNYYIRSIMDHVEDSVGDEVAFRMDFEYDLESSWLESLKVGARYADRDQTVRWTNYNWQNVANNWTGNPQYEYYNIDRHDPVPGGVTGFTGYPDNLYVNRSFNEDFYGGGLFAPYDYVFANMGFLQDQQGFANAMGAGALGINVGTPGGTGWDPICSNMGDRANEIPGTCFTPSEISDVSEETEALYVQLNFGGSDAELFGVPVSGNVGVRYVRTTNTSSGGVAVSGLPEDLFFERIDDPNNPGQTIDVPLPPAYENLGCYPVIPEAGQPPPAVPNTLGCYLSADDVNFALTDADIIGDTSVDHEHWLPSFNIKFEFTDEVLLRFAASRAMSRPDIGNMKYYLGVGNSLPDRSDPNDPLWVKDANGNITGANVYFSGSAQNPFLAPVIADQFDVSLEWYFADVGYAALAVFYKTFDDYIQFGRYNRDVTNNGVTQTVEVQGPLNGEGAQLQGFEVSFQRFFDFLPAPLDGLGVQANYTYIDNQGITNTNITEVGEGGSTITGQAPDQVSVDRLEGLSDNAFTIIGMYEKGSIAARLAYSWRSEYMVTAIDCCVAYPIWNDDYGQLDGSIRWQVTDNIELALSGSNLLNTETELRQQVSNFEDGGLTLPNAWFQNDRRYTISFRYFN